MGKRPKNAGLRLRSAAKAIVPPLLVALLCIAGAMALLEILGYPAREAMRLVWEKAIWPADARMRLLRWSATAQYSTPLLLAGLAVAVAFQGGLWNIGAQGQYLVGSIAATAVALWPAVPMPLRLPAMLAAAIGAGAIWAAVAAILESSRRVPLVLSTLLLNFVAVRLLGALIAGPMREPGGQLQSEVIPPAAQLPLLPGAPLHVGALVALLLAAATSALLWRTTLGFRLRVIGSNPAAARAAGIPVAWVSVTAMGISGAMAGLAGGIEIGGVTRQLLAGEAGSGVGFTAIAVALLGRLSPGGIVAASLFFGFLNTAFRVLEAQMGMPFVTAQIIQGGIVLCMLISGRPGLARRLLERMSGSKEGVML